VARGSQHGLSAPGRTLPVARESAVRENGRAGDGILNAMRRARWDPFAAAASALALTMLVVYLRVIREQEDGAPAAWAVGALIIAAGAAGLGAVVAAPYRGACLGLAAAVLILVGSLAIFSIGLPILVAGMLCIVAVWRSRPAPDS
jgi:hypothetical protein